MDQTASEIRNALAGAEGWDDSMLLEIHSGMTEKKAKGDEEEKLYELISERMDAPIILTTMVGFLHIFLFTEEKEGILLSSYEIPAGADKNTFTYDSMLPVEYSELKKSEKFTPALYVENDGIWEGGSTSQFTPVMKFKLWERFSETGLEVAESMEVNGKRTFGYDVPILYKRA